MLDELPSLEIAATGVAAVLLLRAFRLYGGAGRGSRRARVESARARDLIGLSLLVGGVMYALGRGNASPWLLGAAAVAVVAQITGFYLRAKGVPPAPASMGAVAGAPHVDGPELEIEDEELHACPQCGHGNLIELEEPARLLGGLSALTPVAAVICPACGALSGQVEDPALVPIGAEHGTVLRQSPSSEDQEALEEPSEHDG